MSRVEFEAVVENYHTDREPPAGFEDVFRREYATESADTVLHASSRLGDGKKSIRATETKQKSSGTRTSPFFRFARTKSKGIDQDILAAAIGQKILGAMRDASTLVGGRGTDLTKVRLQHGLCDVKIVKCGQVAAMPSMFMIRLKGGGGVQKQYRESIDRIHISATIEAPIPYEWIAKGIEELSRLAFGPTRRGRIRDVKVLGGAE